MTFQNVSSSVKLGIPGTTDAHDVSDDIRQKQEAAERRSIAKGGAQNDDEIQTISTGEIRAKWKIEVTYGPKRTVEGPNLVGIQVWESGKRFHGGGDELAFFCMDNREGHDEGCWGVIPPDNVGSNGIAYCPHCQRAIVAELLTNMKRGYVSSQNLAKELASIFRNLGSNADIYIKYHMADPRYMAMARAKGPDVARRLKGMHIYPLKNILKDTAAGADVVKRFWAFVTS